MILQQLAEYYDRLATDPQTADTLPKPGYSLQKISFCVVLEPDGKRQQFQSMVDVVGKKALPRQLLVPGQAKPSGSGLNPGWLWDNAAYMLGYKADDPKSERTQEAFAAFRDRAPGSGKRDPLPRLPRRVCVSADAGRRPRHQARQGTPGDRP